MCFLRNVLFVLIFGLATAAQSPDSLVGKVVALKHPTFSTTVKVDANGNLEGKPADAAGATIVNGAALKIDSVREKAGALVIDAHRVVITQRPPQQVLLNDKVRVEIPSGAALGNVFHQGDEMAAAIATYYSGPALGYFPSPKTATDPVITVGGNPVYALTRAVTKPVLKSAPDLKYPDTARRSGLEGVVTLLIVINEEGIPELFQVARTLSPELDEEAVRNVSHWRFKPATMNGKPVAVATNVDVTFK